MDAEPRWGQTGGGAVAGCGGLDSGLTSEGGLAAGGLDGGRLKEKEESGKTPGVSARELERWTGGGRGGGAGLGRGREPGVQFWTCYVADSSPHFGNCWGLRTEAEGRCISTDLVPQTRPSSWERTTGLPAINGECGEDSRGFLSCLEGFPRPANLFGKGLGSKYVRFGGPY